MSAEDSIEFSTNTRDAKTTNTRGHRFSALLTEGGAEVEVIKF
jgi:hypothetical protein